MRCPASGFCRENDNHWFAGIVTTGVDPLVPVSAIENSSITIPNVYLDWMSVSAIQNHLLSYCTATSASLGGASVTNTRSGGPFSAPGPGVSTSPGVDFPFGRPCRAHGADGSTINACGLDPGEKSPVVAGITRHTRTITFRKIHRHHVATVPCHGDSPERRQGMESRRGEQRSYALAISSREKAPR